MDTFSVPFMGYFLVLAECLVPKYLTMNRCPHGTLVYTGREMWLLSDLCAVYYYEDSHSESFDLEESLVPVSWLCETRRRKHSKLHEIIELFYVPQASMRKYGCSTSRWGGGEKERRERERNRERKNLYGTMPLLMSMSINPESFP